MRALSLFAASVWIGLGSMVVACSSDQKATPGSSTSGGASNSGGGAQRGGEQAGGSSNSGGSSTSGGSTTIGGTSTTTGGTSSSGGSGGRASGGTSSSGGNGGRASGGSSTAGTGQTGGTSAGTTGSGGGGTSATGGTSGGVGQSGGTSNTGGGSTTGGTGLSTGGATATGGSSSTGGGSTTGGTGTAQPPFTLPVTPNAWKPTQACIDKAKSLLGSMSAAQKAGQMIQAENIAATTAQVTQYSLGAIFSGGQSDPESGNTAAAWASMVNQYHNAAPTVGSSKIPLLYGIDAVHGHNNVKNATMFPHNIGIGCTRNAELVKQVFRATALEVRGTGINWTFAPTIAAALDEKWGRTFESFSEDPNIAAWIGQAAVDGLQQGTDIKNRQSILGCAKHFAGDGATTNGVDQGDVTLDDATFKRVAVDQYQPLINSGVATIMISYNSVNGQRVTGNAAMVTTLLKGTMGFAGIVVSDYNAILKLPGGGAGAYPVPTAAQVAGGVNAGLDMLMIAGEENWTTTHDLLQQSSTGINPGRIDDAVTRILTVKCEMGMFDSGYTATADSALTSAIGSAEHRTIARQAVRESLVVLKNDGLLPLATTAKVLVAGTAADSMTKQCGGWTIDWQGLGTGIGHSTDGGDTDGTTILEGIQAALGTGNVTYSQNASASTSGLTANIVVVGEEAYAEQYGDATDLTLQARSSADHTALTTALANGLPTVLVVISGRPLVIDSYMSNANLKAVVAAWLPGTEGAGVADVLFGAFTPTGKLGHSWPKSMSQIPINVGDSDYTSDPPAFPIGHGLSW